MCSSRDFPCFSTAEQDANDDTQRVSSVKHDSDVNPTISSVTRQTEIAATISIVTHKQGPLPTLPKSQETHNIIHLESDRKT